MLFRQSILRFMLLFILLLMLAACGGGVKGTPTPITTPASSPTIPPTQEVDTNLKLPEPRLKSDVSLEETLLKRRSIRQYADLPLKLSEVSQLLWAAQGVTDNKGGRTAPSAAAIYPLEIYLVAGKVENLAPGIYQYMPIGHELVKIRDGDVREELGTASMNQTQVKKGAIDIVIAANYEKVLKRFGENSVKWVYLEGGHVAQNICLQANALNLGTVTVGGFTEEQVKSVIGLPSNKGILYVLPVGRKT